MTPEPNQIYTGDCLDVMRSWPDKCVDLVVTDPPYGIGFEYAGYDDTQENWESLIGQCLPEWQRICKSPIIFPGGCHRNRLFLWQRHPPLWTICWFKGSPGHRAAIGFNDWEQLFVYGDDIYRAAHDHFYAKPSDNDVSNGHPCPKSLDFFRILINRMSRPGDTILDPFAGSGTSLVAADQHGRSWIGIEMDPGYAKIAQNRIAFERAQIKLPFDDNDYMPMDLSLGEAVGV